MNINAVMCKGTHIVGHKVALGQVYCFRRVNWGMPGNTGTIFVRIVQFVQIVQLVQILGRFVQFRTTSYSFVQIRTVSYSKMRLCKNLRFSVFFFDFSGLIVQKICFSKRCYFRLLQAADTQD